MATLTEKLVDQIYKQKLNVVSQYFSIPDGILLPFESITSTKFNDIIVNESGETETPTIKGTAYVTYTFHYVFWRDLLAAFTLYLKERSSDKVQVLSIDKNSIKFIKDSSSFEEGELKRNGEMYIIATQINTIQ